MSSVAPSVDVTPNEGSLSGSIRLEVDKDSITTKEIFSPEVEVGGISWATSVRKSPKDADHLQAWFNRIEGDYKVESVNASFEIKLANHNDDSESISRKDEKEFVKSGHWGFLTFVKWSDAIDGEKGFNKNNKLVVQCGFTLSNIKGFRKIHRIDFTDSNVPSHNIALVIEGEKIYVSKQFLAIHSSVFGSMFFGQFAEKDKNEIELKDIIRKEFIELLKVIYPPSKKITDLNIDYLLKLGDRFDITMVVDKCEQFFITSGTITNAYKLLHAGRYRLIELQNHCLGKLKTTKDVKDLKNSESYKDYTDEICLVLFRKIMSISD